MRQFAAASIDRGIDKVEPQQENPAVTPCSVGKAKDGRLHALPRQHAQTWHRLSKINYHLFEGRYSPVWLDGKKAYPQRLRLHPRGVRGKAEGADYMRKSAGHDKVTIARESGASRWTVAKYYDGIQREIGSN